MSDLLLQLRGLGRRFGMAHAVADLSLELAAGEILALIGPSGCGKTTTLRMIAGFETPDSGQILLSGRDITALAPERRGIGIVFQDHALFPQMTVAQNIRFGAKDRSDAALEEMLARLGLSGMGGRFPDQLSGGQQQRVALARSLAAGPGLILLDEPFSSLDPALRAGTRREIRAALKAAGCAVVLVTHDREEALGFADRIAVMSEGRILQCGAVREVFERPVNAFVARALGHANLLPAEASGSVCRSALGDLALEAPREGPLLLSFARDAILLHAPKPGEAANARVTGSEYLGGEYRCFVDCEGTALEVLLAEAPETGAAVRLSLHPDARPVIISSADG